MYVEPTQQIMQISDITADITSDHGFLLRLVNAFTVRSYKTNDAKTFKNLVIHFTIYVLCSGSFNWGF